MDARHKCGLDVALGWSFFRSAKHVVLALDALWFPAIGLVSYIENLDAGPPLGAAAFMVIAAVAALLLEVIVERLMSGFGRARI